MKNNNLFETLVLFKVFPLGSFTICILFTFQNSLNILIQDHHVLFNLVHTLKLPPFQRWFLSLGKARNVRGPNLNCSWEVNISSNVIEEREEIFAWDLKDGQLLCHTECNPPPFTLVAPLRAECLFVAKLY